MKSPQQLAQYLGFAWRARILGFTCFAVLCGILCAGLWPFHAPLNQISWEANQHGLRFGDYGSIFSAGMFPPPNPAHEGSCSIEIRLQPAYAQQSSRFLDFYTADAPFR